MIKGYAVIARPASATLLTSLVVGRLAGAAFPIAFVVSLANTRGYAAAAILQGIMVFALASTAPLRARVLDKFTVRRTIIPQSLLYLLLFAGLVATARQPEAPNWLVGVLALLSAISAPALDTAVRVSWRKMARNEEEVKSLHVLDSITEEAGFLLGPVLASILMLTAGVENGLLATAILISLSNLLTILTPVVRRELLAEVPPAETSSPDHVGLADGTWHRRLLATILGPITRSDLRETVLPVVVTGISFGLLAIAIPNIAAAGGNIAASGFLTATISAGGLIGGLVYGALKLKGSLWRRQAKLALLFGSPLALLPLADSPWFIGGILLISGLAVTPLYINSYLLIDKEIPADVRHEANSWVAVGNDLGYTVGIAVGGMIIAARDYSNALVGVAVVGILLVVIAIRGLSRPQSLMRDKLEHEKESTGDRNDCVEAEGLDRDSWPG
ncbi:MFS transporter [Nonomuraea longispora]|uniref:MFS transporter n=1 Tax=Nonomuraea longispora TaxID=1848320 RepID=A0A4R4N7I2_9ACTN|nr:MFS transporter [Nonomuraea longispora]TDC04831.1 MFS transporter [Nonomuraea longispora]